MCWVIVKVLVELFVLIMVYKVLILCDIEKDNEFYVLEMLSLIFDGYDVVCFNKKLVCEDKVVFLVGVGYDSMGCGFGMFYFFGSLLEGCMVVDFEVVLWVEIVCV